MSTLQTLQLSQLRPCKTNPRHVYAGIDELAESIKAQGIIQRLVVRPMAGKNDVWEIVAGHRRFRAAEVAKLAEVPVEVRDLTDAQVAEIQLVENLQRADLTPMDEAAGFRNLMANGIKADDIASRLGKSRRYVFNKMKLLDLIPKAQEALAKGELVESVALAIARVADPAAQGDVLARALKKDWQGQRPTLREVEEHVEIHVLRKLNGAKFKTTIEIKRADGTVVAGPCTTCPKRSGNQPELYPDKKSANFCTDPSCFNEKSSTAVADRLQKARDAGHTVATKAEAGQFIHENGYSLKGGLENLEHWNSALGTTWGEAIKKASKAAPIPLVVIENPRHPGEIIEAVDPAVAAPALKAAGITPPPSSHQEKREKTKAENAQTLAAMQGAFDVLRKANAGQVGGELLARLVRSDMARVADDDARAMLASVWSPEPLPRKADAVAYFRGLVRTSLETVPPQILQQMLADLALALHAYQLAHGWVHYRSSRDDEPDPLALLTTRLGVDVEAAMREARAQAKAEAKEKAKAKKAAKAKKPAKATGATEDKAPAKKTAAKPAKRAGKASAKAKADEGKGAAQEGAE